MTTTTAPAPRHIARDTHTGRVWAYRPAGQNVSTFTAAELAQVHGQGIVGIIWEYVTTERTSKGPRDVFLRCRVMAHGNELYSYNSEGGRTLIRPADRRVRVMVTR